MAEVGCLVIADVSGYTRYLSGVELEHSQDILADLIGLVVERMGALMKLTKLEGDAVFCFEDGRLTDGHLLVDLIDGCYIAFRQRQRTMVQLTTCQCDACRRIADLDLKFVVHRGAFAIHRVAGRDELVGPEVILVHRLLKNRVATDGYALLTAASVDGLHIDPSTTNLAPHAETYDDVGTVDGWCRDLRARFDDEEARTSINVDDPAFCTIEADLSAPPAVVWEFLTSPDKRILWQPGADRIDQENPNGRGVGTVNHCVHGKKSYDEVLLDWKPFNYFTLRTKTPVGPFIVTDELIPTEHGTHLVMRARLDGGAGQRMILLAAGRTFRSKMSESIESLTRVVTREVKEQDLEALSSQPSASRASRSE